MTQPPREQSVDLATGTLLLSGLDLIEGTPVLDIKPYIPSYDAIADAKVPRPAGTRMPTADKRKQRVHSAHCLALDPQNTLENERLPRCRAAAPP